MFFLKVWLFGSRLEIPQNHPNVIFHYLILEQGDAKIYAFFLLALNQGGLGLKQHMWNFD